MVSDSDIRQWATEHGLEVNTRGRVRADVLAEYQAAHPPGGHDDGETDAVIIELPAESPSVVSPGPGFPAGESPAPGGHGRRPETPPAGQKTSPWSRRKKPETPAAGKAAKGKAKPRVSVATLGSWAWGLGGMALSQFPNSVPVGRCLMIQSAVAGEVIDDLAKGTIVDTILQPFARGSEKAEKAFALLGPPLLVGILANKPELAPALTPALKIALLSWAEISGPAMQRAERKASQMAERMGEVDIDAMIAAMFTDVPLGDIASEDEEAAIRRAHGNA